jgi:hypothetical protein
MTLESIQQLIEINSRNLPGGKGRPAHKADNLTAICEPIVSSSGSQRGPCRISEGPQAKVEKMGGHENFTSKKIINNTSIKRNKNAK